MLCPVFYTFSPPLSTSLHNGALRWATFIEQVCSSKEGECSMSLKGMHHTDLTLSNTISHLCSRNLSAFLIRISNSGCTAPSLSCYNPEKNERQLFSGLHPAEIPLWHNFIMNIISLLIESSHEAPGLQRFSLLLLLSLLLIWEDFWRERKTNIPVKAHEAFSEGKNILKSSKEMFGIRALERERC